MLKPVAGVADWIVYNRVSINIDLDQGPGGRRAAAPSAATAYDVLGQRDS
jgi:hypothetical protein